MPALDLNSAAAVSSENPKVQRLNKLPIIVAICAAVLVLVIIFWGIMTRGGENQTENSVRSATGGSTLSFAERLKDGAPKGVISNPRNADKQDVLYTRPSGLDAPATKALANEPFENPFKNNGTNPSQHPDVAASGETPEEMRERLRMEEDEAMLRLRKQKRMADHQANQAAIDSPTNVDISQVRGRQPKTVSGTAQNDQRTASNRSDLLDLYRSSLTGTKQESDTNGQAGKQAFLNGDYSDAGYLAKPVAPQLSPFELKRGSVIPATLITGVNSDLPGRMTAQVRQNIYDTATGRLLLIPQGTKLFGRYDSDVTFGQNRVLVVWTDIIFPDGSTLQLAGMAGVDVEGFGGFADKVNNHYFRTFGSAALLAVIGAGIDIAVPESSTLASQSTASDAARRSFAEVFGRVAEQTISKNLEVQPTIEIRPGYKFNILVDQDIVFPGGYKIGSGWGQ